MKIQNVDLFHGDTKFVLLSRYEKLEKENEQLKKELIGCKHLLSKYVYVTTREIKFPEFDHIRCDLFRIYNQLVGYKEN